MAQTADQRVVRFDHRYRIVRDAGHDVLARFSHSPAAYLTKDAPTAVLVAAVRKAAVGGKHVSPALLERLASLIGGGTSSPNRELEVFKLIAAGQSLVRIGELMHLSPNTVTTYRTRILEKMGLGSNAELTRYALANGII